MKKKTILITGAASGIGLATAKLFVQKGWFVGMMDVQENLLSDLSEKFGPENCCYHIMDVTDMESVSRAVQFFSEKTGHRMDALFNCAGILRMGPHHLMDIEMQHQTIDVNFKGILNCVKASFEMLRQTENAHIINMSSASSIYGTLELAVYSATKFAVRGLTEALNIEYEPFDITVCDVAASYVRTPMILNAERQAISIDRLGVSIEPEDVAQSIWESAHGKKVHRKVGLMTKLCAFFVNAFPFAAKPVIKLLAFSPDRSGSVK